jgi:hypothetical protein
MIPEVDCQPLDSGGTTGQHPGRIWTTLFGDPEGRFVALPSEAATSSTAHELELPDFFGIIQRSKDIIVYSNIEAFSNDVVQSTANFYTWIFHCQSEHKLVPVARFQVLVRPDCHKSSLVHESNSTAQLLTFFHRVS